MIWILTVIGIIILDQYTKYLAATKLIKYGSIPIIKNVFHFTYVENRGAAFGILQDKKWFFVILTIVVIVAITVYIIKNKPESKLLMTSLSMIIGGAIGNLIDRVRFSYVVDFFDFNLIKFPVFNVADSFVVIGTILLAYFLLFKYEDKENKNAEDKA